MLSVHRDATAAVGINKSQRVGQRGRKRMRIRPCLINRRPSVRKNVRPLAISDRRCPCLFAGNRRAGTMIFCKYLPVKFVSCLEISFKPDELYSRIQRPTLFTGGRFSELFIYLCRDRSPSDELGERIRRAIVSKTSVHVCV